MTKRIVLCEGPDDLNALRAVAQLLRWAKPAQTIAHGAGHDRLSTLQAGDASIEIKVPSKARGATGEGKSVLAGSVAGELRDLRPQVSPTDEACVSLIAVVFDPDASSPESFYQEIAATIGAQASAWSLANSAAAGVWSATRAPDEQPVEVRAVPWRAPGGVLDGLPDHINLERLLCAVASRAYPGEVEHVARWLTEINERRSHRGSKPTTWKAAIHVWLALVYEKADEHNAAARFLHQQDECRPHVQPVLDDVGLVADLRPLLGPA